jgi:hypothetical protein
MYIPGMSKTTVLMSDEVLHEARIFSQKRNTTLANVMEAALIDYMARQKSTAPFKLKKKHSRKTGGMLIDDWDTIRDTIYSERDERIWKR